MASVCWNDMMSFEQCGECWNNMGSFGMRWGCWSDVGALSSHESMMITTRRCLYI